MGLITKETYNAVIRDSMHDERLNLADVAFLIKFVYLLDKSGQDSLQLPQRALIDELGLSMGAVGHAIDTLIKAEYLVGSMEPNPKGHKSYRLQLGDKYRNNGLATFRLSNGTTIKLSIDSTDCEQID